MSRFNVNTATKSGPCLVPLSETRSLDAGKLSLSLIERRSNYGSGAFLSDMLS